MRNIDYRTKIDNLRSCSNFRTAICSLKYTHREYRFVVLRWQRLFVLINKRMSETRKQAKLTNDCPTKGHVPTKVYITSHSQMVKFQNLGNLLEPLLELMDLRGKKKDHKLKYNALSKGRKKRNKVPS